MIKKELTNSANSKSQMIDLIKDILDIKKIESGRSWGRKEYYPNILYKIFRE